jgi:hypothetical protein
MSAEGESPRLAAQAPADFAALSLVEMQMIGVG